MKGVAKAFSRMPHMVTTKVGLSKKSNDPEFDDYNNRFHSLEQAIEKLIKDTKVFSEAVTNLFTHGSSFANHFSALFRPMVGEYDVIGKHPDAEHTIKNVDAYEGALEELKGMIVPELELIESRILGPMKELQGVIKSVGKSITKRDHKLVDYDRYNNSLNKLREKKEKTLNDEKNLFKLEQDFELASNEYETINSTMKIELPKFMIMATQFIDPLFHSFYYMQLNIFYILLEKLNGFSEGRYEIGVPPAQIVSDWEERRGDAAARIEELGVLKRIVSTSKLVQQNRAVAGTSEKAPIGRSVSSTTSNSDAPSPRTLAAPPPARSPSSVSASSYTKKAPPPPPGSSSPSISSAPPPPYTPSANLATKPVSFPKPSVGSVAAAVAAANASSVAGKKAPPPPPPLKPKPKPAAQYVVALYDFEAQADGDLDFKAGDRIEVVERSKSTEDWWTGKLRGKQGVFPGNYVQDT